jgi:hypothetical protein
MSNTPPGRSKVTQWLLIALFILLAAVVVVEAAHDLTKPRTTMQER